MFAWLCYLRFSTSVYVKQYIFYKLKKHFNIRRRKQSPPFCQICRSLCSRLRSVKERPCLLSSCCSWLDRSHSSWSLFYLKGLESGSKSGVRTSMTCTTPHVCALRWKENLMRDQLAHNRNYQSEGHSQRQKYDLRSVRGTCCWGWQTLNS